MKRSWFFEIPPNLSADLLFKELKTYCSTSDVERAILAYDFADEAHKDKTRNSGEPYIIHPLTTAYFLAKMHIDINIVIAGMLHDVPEDTEVTIEEIEKNFGEDIANMLRGITKLGKLKYRGMERYIENLRKMFLAMAEDMRVMIIKFADRIHNLKTLEYHTPAKQYRIAKESLEIYAPIANRLGMGEFRGALEDLAFPFVYPEDYEKVKIIRNNFIAEAEKYLENTIHKTKKELENNDIEVIDMHGRKKQLYSLYQKCLDKNWEVEQIYDIVALRIIVKDLGDCYASLGIIHKLWRPLKGRIKDYIAQPKPNGYQSLHTTVFCDDGKIVEFQIRTPEIHAEAEYGIAAHWHYNEKGKAKIPTKDIPWAKELAKIQKEVLNNMSDLENVKLDFFQNRIFVFTPVGDVID
ncbi:MAG: HD domain-containing protein, partial [Candidatus Magasanikbacteria bacterium]|nr:HD domain-containing protein [Candidatus Magasanikbacteria bacterium]